MKKGMLILLAAMVLPMAAWAYQADMVAPSGGEWPVSFGVQLSGGMLYGEANEHVYDYDTGRRRQLSRLDWDLKNVAMGGVNFSVRPLNFDKGIDIPGGMTFNTANGLTLNFGYWIALTKGNGKMDDYDWLDTGTYYSLSDVDVTEGYIRDLNVAWDFIQWKDILTGRVFAGYKQNGWTWEDSGVYLEYPEYFYIRQYLNGENLINYEQEFRMPYIGTGLDGCVKFKPGELTVSGRLTYSPSVEATDWDEHVARDMHYTEEFEGGDMVSLGLEARYSVTRGFFNGAFFSAAFDYQVIELMIGDVEYYGAETDGIVYSAINGAGIENEYMIISLGGGYRF